MKACFCIALPLAALVLASCAGDKKETAATSPAPRTLNERLNEKTGFTQNSEGKWVPRVNRRSSFESKGASPYFQGEYGKKEYKAGDYAKKQWLGGDKAFDKKAYAGNTDGGRFMKDSRFGGQAAREGSQSAGEAGKSAREAGGSYATGEAREARAKAIDKPSDAETDSRRGKLPFPSVIDWQEQRSLSVDQTKGLLGR